MWLFNPNSINNLLLFLLLFVMLLYLVIRSKKNREIVFLVIFIVQLLAWQLCFLFRNIYFDPAGSYPLYYFLNSGYTVVSYLSMVMFSYYFIAPVFKKESRIVGIAGLLVSAGFIVYFFIFIFPGRIETFFDPVLHVYDAKPAPHRTYLIAVLIVFIVLTAKNLVYKIVTFRGEQRSFVLNITVSLMTGVSAVVGVSLLQHYYPVNTNVHNAINTYLAGLMFLYFYLVYLSSSRIPFLYSDKAILLILFIMIIISSMTTSLTFMIYDRGYINEKKEMVRRIARDIDMHAGDEGRLAERLGRLYGDGTGYIITRKKPAGQEHVYWGAERPLRGNDLAMPAGDVRHWFHGGDEAVYYCFETKTRAGVLHVGIPYLQYRLHVHDFVKAGLVTVLAIICILFIFMRFLVFIGLTRPLKRLLSGVAEIRGGNLDHRIEVSAQDEIGFISGQFNLMVADLRVSGDAIKKSERKFRELTGMLPDIVYETDLDLNITYFNRAGMEITGFGDADVKEGLSLHELLDDDEYDRLRSLLTGAGPGRLYKITTHRLKGKNGITISCENNAAVIYENGAPIGLRGVLRDVTEKIRTEISLLQAQKMETIGTLAGGIAHDFNNILTGITGTVSLLEYGLSHPGSMDTAELKSNLGILKKAADRAADMVKQLLSLSRRRKPVLERVDLNAVIRSVYEICKNSFDKKISLDFHYLEGGAYTMADETQMGQVLLNLCVNAQDSMTTMRPEGSEHSGTLSVNIDRLDADPDLRTRFPDASDRPYFRLRVRDTGVGMEPGTIARVFDPFFTTKKKGKGTGLGLAMVYNIIKQHYGFIDIHSVLSSGTAVDLYIPVNDSAASPGPPAPESIEYGAASGTILLVDDDPIVQKTCGDMLKKLGYTLITAGDGREAIGIYRERRDAIDIVILDVMMPVMSGNEAFEELKKINPDIRVAVSSGYGEDPRIDEMFAKGARGFIQKPYTMETLAKEISRIMMKK